MRIFISGTDTDIGKTIISSWLCLHTGYDYFKPIQTGDIDSAVVSVLSGSRVHRENVSYPDPVSPHLAAHFQGEEIDLDTIVIPDADNLVIEGAGGVLVPINKNNLIVDMIRKFAVPVILVARSTLGTINHTLLSIEALRNRNIDVLGVIINGEPDQNNAEAISYYGNVEILAVMPRLPVINQQMLLNVPLTDSLKYLLE